MDQCIEFYYELSNPISGRVELLRGTIKEPFSRKDYIAYYDISEPTASLDLRKAVEKGLLSIKGDKRNAKYWYRGNTGIEYL